MEIHQVSGQSGLTHVHLNTGTVQSGQLLLKGKSKGQKEWHVKVKLGIFPTKNVHTPLKTNMAYGKSTIFNRNYILKWWVFRWHVSRIFTGDWNPGKASQEIWMDYLFPAKKCPEKILHTKPFWKSQSWLFGEGTSGYQWLISQLWSTIDRKVMGRIFIATLHPKKKRQALFPKKLQKGMLSISRSLQNSSSFSVFILLISVVKLSWESGWKFPVKIIIIHQNGTTLPKNFV